MQVRRRVIFIEESIHKGTQWVVQEPNDEALWARVRRSVTDFLTNAWRQGPLQGRTEEEAFFVKCDHTTITQNDLDNGRLVRQIGIARVKPAAFVIFRIIHSAGTEQRRERRPEGSTQTRITHRRAVRCYSRARSTPRGR